MGRKASGQSDGGECEEQWAGECFRSTAPLMKNFCKTGAVFGSQRYIVVSLMDTSNPALKPLPPWKRLAIISLFCGAGFALMSGLILGGVVWYTSRPTPPKPWNATVIASKGPPGFSVSSDGSKVDFSYTVENRTKEDYHIRSSDEIQVMLRTNDGTLSEPLSEKETSISLPIFIPPQQKAFLDFSVSLANIPQRNTAEPDQQFHERVRTYLNQYGQSVSGFVIFDSTNRYQIELPKWLAEAPKGNAP
jgi:hypothetical protein